MAEKKKQLLFALIMAALAVIVTQLYIEKETVALRPTDLIDVAAAAQPIQSGTPLTAALVKKRTLSRSLAPVSAIPYEELEEYIGQNVAANIVPGDYLLQTHFEIRRSVGATLSEQVIGKGGRAVTIPVSDTSSLSNSIVTGDIIDIIYTFTVPGSSAQMSTALLQGVPVISTGDYSPESAEIGGMQRNQYSTVTLLLNAQDAFRLKFAQKNGQIDILLRNRADSEPATLSPISTIRDVLSENEQAQYDQVVQANTPSKEELESVRSQIMDQVRANSDGGK